LALISRVLPPFRYFLPFFLSDFRLVGRMARSLAKLFTTFVIRDETAFLSHQVFRPTPPLFSFADLVRLFLPPPVFIGICLTHYNSRFHPPPLRLPHSLAQLPFANSLRAVFLSWSMFFFQFEFLKCSRSEAFFFNRSFDAVCVS